MNWHKVTQGEGLLWREPVAGLPKFTHNVFWMAITIGIALAVLEVF